MQTWKPDPSFYPSPAMAAEAPDEKLAYVALLNPTREGTPDAVGVVDVDPASASYGHLIGGVNMPSVGDELHHFGWNACSSCLCPYAPHPHMERRYLVVPGMRSSQIHILDTKPDPKMPTLVKTIDAARVAAKSGYAKPHTVHCGPDGIYMNALGAPDGGGPGGVFMLDPDTFDVTGAWEADRGPQYLSYDFGWHLGQDVMITSEWGTPSMFENGLVPEQLLAGRYGHALHVWDLNTRRHLQRLELGAEQQMVLEVRPAHDPTRSFGFAGVVVSLEDLSASVWLWHREGGDSGRWAVTKVISIPAEPAPADLLPPMLKGFGAVPPFVTDLNLSTDDRTLYVSCWGTGELRQYDVTNPFAPRLTGSVQLGGIVRRTPHPSKPDQSINGGPQMVEVSRDGRRVYVTNSLYTALDAQFYPDGIKGWMAKMDVSPDGNMTVDQRFFLETGDMRPHQVRLQGGDASSDSYCFA